MAGIEDNKLEKPMTRLAEPEMHPAPVAEQHVRGPDEQLACPSGPDLPVGVAEESDTQVARCEPPATTSPSSRQKQQEDLMEINRICQSTDLYEVLGVPKASPEPEIRQAYKKLALRLHPDKCQLPDAVKAFQVVADAYWVLSDAGRRRQYDITGQASTGKSTTSHTSAKELFNAVFTGYSDPSKMTMCELITNNYPRLKSKLDGDVVCLHLLHRQVITHDHYETYKGKQYPENNNYLLNMLRKKPKDCLLKFLETLLETHQDYLLIAEEGEKGKDDMLRDHRVRWEQELNPDVLGPHLYQMGILTTRDWRIYKSKPSIPDKNSFLLDKLRRGPVQAFIKFRDLLKTVPNALLPVDTIPCIGHQAKPGTNVQPKASTSDNQAPSTSGIQAQVIQLPDGADKGAQFVTRLKDMYQKELKTIELLPGEEDSEPVTLDCLYIELSLERETRKGVKTETTLLNGYPEIFVKNDDEPNPPRRILCEGEAGSGKSTLINKMSYDWGSQKELKLFTAAYLVRLRAVEKDSTLASTVQQEWFLGEEEVEQEIRRHLKEQEDKSLILLDGYDEYQNQSTELNEIIRGKRMKNATVIITTRPTRLLGHHTDRFVRVKGLSKAQRIAYVTKYFSDPVKGNCLLQQIMENKLEDICKVPVILLLFCRLFLESESGKLPNTLTALYNEVVDLLWKRHQKKEETDDQQTTTEVPPVDMLNSLGNLAWINLKKDTLEFPLMDSEHIRQALNLGILRKTMVKRKNFVNFIHKTFQEYFASHWLIHSERNFHELLGHCDTFQKILDMSKVIEFLAEFAKKKKVPTATLR